MEPMKRAKPSSGRTYLKPQVKVWGKVEDLTQAGASHAGSDGVYYDQKGYYGSVIRPVDN